MLGSILTNLLFVFGMSCLMGGVRWQVQELRIVSGNVSVGMLMLAAAGSVLPAALFLSGQLPSKALDDEVPSHEELVFCRVNALVMVIMYLCYLLFQLGTHKSEFDDNEQSTANNTRQNTHPARRNLWCQHYILGGLTGSNFHVEVPHNRCLPPARKLEKFHNSNGNLMNGGHSADNSLSSRSSLSDTDHETENSFAGGDRNSVMDENTAGSVPQSPISAQQRRRRRQYQKRKPENTDPLASISSHGDHSSFGDDNALPRHPKSRNPQNGGTNNTHHATERGKLSVCMIVPDLRRQLLRVFLTLANCSQSISLPYLAVTLGRRDHSHPPVHHQPQLSFRAGLLWLFIITLCISSMSDILVDTLEGFAQRSNLSQVFTSLVVVPYFSNIAEQASAILFAYRNEMDLCIGVTVGSAIQIGALVMPGSVLIGWMMDRSMTLYFHGYETACYLVAVLVVAAVIQGGTTNWLVGSTMIGLYVMMAAGFWVHETEDLSVDAELVIRNITRS
jgi:Ca2+/H+ antiporter